MRSTACASTWRKTFERIDHIDLHGNVRRNPKLSGTTHNVFGIQVGVGITLAVKKQGAQQRLRYHRVPEAWRKSEKLEFLSHGEVSWHSQNSRCTVHMAAPGRTGMNTASSSASKPCSSPHTAGVKTNRDDVVYDWDRDKLSGRVKQFVDDIQRGGPPPQVEPGRRLAGARQVERDLKKAAARGEILGFSEAKIVPALYRPFSSDGYTLIECSTSASISGRRSRGR